jgi:hypothetical protein
MSRLSIWVPTNRTDRHGRYTHMDGWNEIKHALETNRNIGSKLIREDVQHVAMWAKLAMRKQRWPQMDKAHAVPCKVTLTFVERDHRRDVGNIHGGAKYALDGLTKRHEYGAGAIYDDSQVWLPEVEYRIAYVSERFTEPGIQIDIETLED